MSIRAEDKFQRDEINRRIKQIGDVYGAQDIYFGWGTVANGHVGSQARFVDSEACSSSDNVCLCCVPLNEQLVILLNGGRRTMTRIEDCPICGPHFDLACRVSAAIGNGIDKGLIEVDGVNLLMDDKYILKL